MTRRRPFLLFLLLAIPVYLLVTRCAGSRAAPEVSKADLAHLEVLAGEAMAPHDDLSRALAIAARHEAAWSARKDADPSRPLADYPEGGAAIDALGRWADRRGALPPRGNELAVLRLGLLAIESATAAAPAGLEVGRKVGYRLVTEGRGLFEGSLGAALLRRAAARARALGLPEATRWVPPRGTFARVLAAEALAVHREDWTGPETSAADQRRMLAFWVAVLRNVGDEPAATTLARFRQVTPPPGAEHLGRFVQDLFDELARLQASP